MKRSRILSAFTPEEYQRAHTLLATRVAFIMGRKLEEGDWAEVYCRAKGIPLQGWSNLQIDVMHNLLGVEHKMLRRRSDLDIRSWCGQRLMHPSATRSIRVPPSSTDPDVAMEDVLSQYGQLIEARRQKVREKSGQDGEADLRTGWLLWQESLRQFLYFEEEMIVPDPQDYTAQWVSVSSGRARKSSTNLWIFEKDTNAKRFSVTNEAGAKIQPYFDIPPPNNPHLYIWTVIGEVLMHSGLVRVWVTEATARELKHLLGALDTETLSKNIIEVASIIKRQDVIEQSISEIAQSFLLSPDAYEQLQQALPGINDEHSFQLLAQHIRNEGGI